MISDIVQITGTLTDADGIQASLAVPDGIDGSLFIVEPITAQMAVEEGLECTLTDTATLTATITIPEIAGATYYDGDYEITPGDTPQTMATHNLLMRDNVTIGAIPSNYGRIEWNGSRLMVY